MKQILHLFILLSFFYFVLLSAETQTKRKMKSKDQRRQTQQRQLQNQYQSCGSNQQSIAVVKEQKQSNQRLTQINVQESPHNFKMKFVANTTKFKYDSTRTLRCCQILGRYFEHILYVTPLPSSSSIYQSTNNSCGTYTVDQTYKTVGFNTAQTDMIVFVDAYNKYENSIVAPYLCVLSRWPTYTSLSFNEYRAYNRSSTQYDYYHFIMVHTLHQMIHNLGFNYLLYGKFYTSYKSGEFKDISQVFTQYNSTYSMIITPSVVNYVQKYFGCDQQIGAFLENYGATNGLSQHWQYTIYYAELLMGMYFNAPIFISELSLSLLKDTNYYYKVDIALSNPMNFGRGKGCNFAKGIIGPDYYPDYNSNVYNDNCSLQHDFGGYYTSNSLLPNRFIQIHPSSLGYSCHRPSDVSSGYYGQVFGYSSMSVTIDGVWGAMAYCVQYECLPDNQTVLFTYDTYSINCTQAQQRVFLEDLGSTFQCPINVLEVCRRKMCVDFCSLNGFCANQTCFMLDCSNIANCKTCTSDYDQTLHCQSCISGYYPSQTKQTCLACSSLSGCSSCGVQLRIVMCYSCTDSFMYPIYLDDGSFERCSECSDVINNCTDCAHQLGYTFCNACSSPTYKSFDRVYCGDCGTIIQNCTLCIDDGNGFPFCILCDLNLYPKLLDNSQCLICKQAIPYCKTCNNNDGNVTCLQCESNLYLQNDENNQCKLCKTFIQNCTNCLFQNSTRLCISCSTSLFPDLYQLFCKTCQKVIQNCTSCKNNNGVTECLACKSDSFVDTNLHCSLCNSNCKTCFGNSKNCTSCPDKDNQYISMIGTCNTISFIYPGFAGTCLVNQQMALCPLGCQICQCYGELGSFCRLTALGYTIGANMMIVQCPQNCEACVQANTTLSCSKCFEGYALVNDTCEKCSESCVVCNSSSLEQCTSCPEGTYLNTNDICSSCLVNNCYQCSHPKYCTKCYSGYYINENFDHCLQCPTGCSICQSRNYTSCTGCGPGFYLVNNECNLCGSHCKVCISAFNCTICSQGYVLNNKTAKCETLCTFPCYKCQQNNPTVCTSCLAGYTYDSSSKMCNPQLNCNPCLVCPLGYQILNGNCQKCSVENSITCNSTRGTFECAKGYFVKENICQSCMVGCQICKDQDTCRQCGSGYTKRFSNNTQYKGGMCYACQPPCKTCYANVTNCQSCIENYKLKGWKCEYNDKISFEITISADYDQFIINNGLVVFKEHIYNLVGRTYKSNSTVFTIYSVKQGSTIIQGSIANYPEFNVKSCLLLAKLSDITRGARFSGFVTLSSDFSSSQQQEPCPQPFIQEKSVNETIGIAVGVAVGVIVLVVLIIGAFLLILRRIRKSHEITAQGHQNLKDFSYISESQISHHDARAQGQNNNEEEQQQGKQQLQEQQPEIQPAQSNDQDENINF